MIDRLRSRWQGAILVCGKCEKKLGKAGFGAKRDQRLSKLLRKRLGGGRKRGADMGVVTTGCLGVCPREAVTMVDAAHPRDWLIVHAGTPIDEVIGRLAADEALRAAA